MSHCIHRCGCLWQDPPYQSSLQHSDLDALTVFATCVCNSDDLLPTWPRYNLSLNTGSLSKRLSNFPEPTKSQYLVTDLNYFGLYLAHNLITKFNYKSY